MILRFFGEQFHCPELSTFSVFEAVFRSLKVRLPDTDACVEEEWRTSHNAEGQRRELIASEGYVSTNLRYRSPLSRRIQRTPGSLSIRFPAPGTHDRMTLTAKFERAASGDKRR